MSSGAPFDAGKGSKNRCESDGKTAKASGSMITYEKDPNYFIFKNEVPHIIKMHVQPLELRDWIRVDATFPDHMALRCSILADSSKRSEVVVSSAWASTKNAKLEVLQMLLDYLPVRYPSLYKRVSRSGGSGGNASGLFVRPTGDTVWLTASGEASKTTTSSSSSSSKAETDSETDTDPLVLACSLIQEDLCIMESSPEHDNAYILTAGIVTFSCAGRCAQSSCSRWRASTSQWPRTRST